MAGGCPAPSFQRERFGRAGHGFHTCNLHHLTLGHLMRHRSPPSGHPTRQFSKTAAALKDGFKAPACVHGRHFLSCGSVIQADSRGGARAGGVPGELPGGLACALFLESLNHETFPVLSRLLGPPSLPGSSFRQHPSRNCFWPVQTGFMELLRMTVRALLGPVFWAV